MAKKKKNRRWARNTADATARARATAGNRQTNTEDSYVRGRRIKDVGQKVPEGYMRTGGRYFAKVENMRPIRSKTTDAQRALVYSNRERFWGVDGTSGWLRRLGNTGMYDGLKSEANFRKNSTARKMIDRDGGTYGPDYGRRAGAGTRAKSRYIIAFGQDGHKR